MPQDVIDPRFHLIEDEGARREAWIRTIAPVFVPTLDRSEPLPRDIGFRCWRAGPILMSSIRASAQSIERTRSQIATQAADQVILRLYGTGRSSLDTAAGPVDVPEGAVAVFDLSQRARSVSAGMTGVNVCIPRRLFDARVGEVGDLHLGLHRPMDGPLVRLLSDHLGNARHCLDAADAAQRHLVGSATVALVNAALTPVRDSAHDAGAVAAIAIRQWIEVNLARPELGVEMLLARFGLSRSPLYALFEPEGGVMAYIRGRRLARAMRMLSGADGTGPRRVSVVAYAVGYASPKMFSKAFHARYGVNPRDVDATYREGARRETGSALLSWIREL